jgi:hypothetical protein
LREADEDVTPNWRGQNIGAKDIEYEELPENLRVSEELVLSLSANSSISFKVSRNKSISL